MKIGIILFGQVFMTWTIMFVAVWILENIAKQELKDFLKQPNLTVRLNGQLIDKINSDSIVKELMKVSNIQAHRSSSY